jgi:hypothetical protein
MAIYRNTPSIRIINGHEIKTSDSVVVTNTSYSTNGEFIVVVRGVDYCEVFLDSKTTDHIVIKSLTYVLIKADSKIDDEFDEIEIGEGASVEFKNVGGIWYIISSDGLKGS